MLHSKGEKTLQTQAHTFTNLPLHTRPSTASMSVQRGNATLPVHTDSESAYISSLWSDDEMTTNGRTSRLHIFVSHFNMQRCIVCPSTLIRNDDTIRRCAISGFRGWTVWDGTYRTVRFIPDRQSWRITQKYTVQSWIKCFVPGCILDILT